MRLSMERNGEFEVQWTPHNENQCGFRHETPAPSKMWYKVILVGDSRHLNTQGFIVDQFQVHQCFLDCFSTIEVIPSCEGISFQACEKLWEMLGPACVEGQRVWFVRVTVGAVGPDGDHWAGITAELPDGPDPMVFGVEARQSAQ